MFLFILAEKLCLERLRFLHFLKTCGMTRRSIWVVEQFWCLYPLQGQNNIFCWGDQANLYKVRNPPNRGTRINLSVPCLSEGFKTQHYYMCRTNKTADRHCLCQSLASKDLTVKFSPLYSVTTKYKRNCVISDFHCEINENCVLLCYHWPCTVKNWLFSSQFITVTLCTPWRLTP